MKYCATHNQWYPCDSYCTYCGLPSWWSGVTTNLVLYCDDCKKSTAGKCLKHSKMIYEQPTNKI